MLIDCPLEASPTVENHAHSRADPSRRQATIDILSDDALLYVFDFYVAQTSEVEAWHTLIHVCRRWRILVFGSPRRLNLRIECRCKAPFMEKLDIWPALPIVIFGACGSRACRDNNHNIEGILKHHDRVRWIELYSRGQVEEIFAALEKPFPELTDLILHADQSSEKNIFYPDPELFMGGSTHLRSLSLTYISIPELLPKLLLSSTDLVDLRLRAIEETGYDSPDEMVTALSAMTRLQVLHLDLGQFEWEIRRLPLPTRTVLPSLIILRLGLSDIKHLDGFMARIDTPLLNRLDIVVKFYETILLHIPARVLLDAPQILRFIGHVPKFQAFDEAYIEIDLHILNIWIKTTRTSSDVLKLKVKCRLPEILLPQFCRSQIFPLSRLESLYINWCSRRARWPGLCEPVEWPEILRPFTSVKNLYLCEGDSILLRIASDLRQLGGEIVLPALESLFLEQLQPSGPVREALGKLVAARALSGHPITVSQWDKESEIRRLRSHDSTINKRSPYSSNVLL